MSEIVRLKLAFTNAAEDVPRLITAYGKGYGGELALVLRPTEGRGLLAWASRGKGKGWRAQSSDTVQIPSDEEPLQGLLDELKMLQQNLGAAGPMTLRGQWAGVLALGESPILEMVRSISAYARVRIQSAEQGWRWQVERLQRWFGEPTANQGQAVLLTEAITSAMASAMGIVGEACSVRDTRRRSAYDAQWAVEHPNRPAKEPATQPAAKFNPKVKAEKPPKPAKEPKTPKAEKAPRTPKQAPAPQKFTMRTAAELLSLTQAQTQALLEDPSAASAKQWVKAALSAMGAAAASIQTKAELRPGGAGGYAVKLLLKPSEEEGAAQATILTLEQTLGAKGAPPLRLETWGISGAESRTQRTPKAPQVQPAPTSTPAKGKKGAKAQQPPAEDPRDKTLLAAVGDQLGKLDLSSLV